MLIFCVTWLIRIVWEIFSCYDFVLLEKKSQYFPSFQLWVKRYLTTSLIPPKKLVTYNSSFPTPYLALNDISSCATTSNADPVRNPFVSQLKKIDVSFVWIMTRIQPQVNKQTWRWPDFMIHRHCDVFWQV